MKENSRFSGLPPWRMYSTFCEGTKKYFASELKFFFGTEKTESFPSKIEVSFGFVLFWNDEKQFAL